MIFRVEIFFKNSSLNIFENSRCTTSLFPKVLLIQTTILEKVFNEALFDPIFKDEPAVAVSLARSSGVAESPRTSSVRAGNSRPANA